MAAKSTYFGIAFPFKKSSTSFPAAASDEDLIQQSIVQIVTTGRNQRVMRPDFGCNAYAFVFENNDLILQETMRAEVMTSIAKFEPRVIVQSVITKPVAPDATNPSDEVEIEITINYIIIATRKTQSVTITMS